MSEPAGRELRLLSVVAPIFNEQETVQEFISRVFDALEGLDFEFVLVDDGSTDQTPELLRELADEHDQIRLISLSRNFGHQAALTAGLDHARGDVVVMIDADLQDPPELIPR